MLRQLTNTQAMDTLIVEIWRLPMSEQQQLVKFFNDERAQKPLKVFAPTK